MTKMKILFVCLLLIKRWQIL